jgi:hypothetical protein
MSSVEPWNSLPDPLKKAASKEAFKREWRQLRKQIKNCSNGKPERNDKVKMKSMNGKFY